MTRPIVFLSVFKSGTHLVRRILEGLTGTPFFEPPIVRGKVNYRDAEQLIFVPDHFYSWHLVPTQEVSRRLVEADARCVLLVRNMYDLAVSMYHHFAGNIDADIGRGRNVDTYFREMSVRDGLAAVISGMVRPDFRWAGIGPHLEHMQSMFELSAVHPSVITSYERIAADKPREVQRIATYLDTACSPDRLHAIVDESSFGAMQATALAQGKGSHFRRGRAGSHVDELDEDLRALIREQMASHAPRLQPLADAAGFGEVFAQSGDVPVQSSNGSTQADLRSGT